MGIRGTSIAGELGVAVMGGSLHFMVFTYRNLTSFSQGGSEWSSASFRAGEGELPL